MRLQARTSEYLILAVLLVFSSGLILANLGNIYLWEDEAQTALLAKTILTHGVPLGYDGKNYFSQLEGAECGKNFIWKWHPWFPFYLLAGFFAVFGTSTFVARLPFALLGIATVVLAYFYGNSLWRIRRAGILSAVLLMTCVPFLLLVRQCRYYAPAAFLSLAGLYAYSAMLERRKYASLAFVISAVLLFHTHYVYCAALLAATAVHTLLYRRNILKLLVLLLAIIAVINVPWIIWLSSMGGIAQNYSYILNRTVGAAGIYGRDLAKHIFHPALLLLPVVFYALRRIGLSPKPVWDRSTGSNLVLLLLFSVFTVAGLSPTDQLPFFRYLAPLIPVACIIMGLIVESGMKIHPAVGVIIIGLLAWWWRMPDYLYEITHDYDGPVEGTVQFLNANARPSDVVAVSHEDLPIKWYTNLRVIGPTSGEDFKPALNADWLVMRNRFTNADLEFIHYLWKNFPLDRYEPIALPFPDITFENRESPDWHQFRTVTDAPPIMIYRRIRG